MRLLKNFLYLSGGEAVSKVATFAAIAYLARMLGPVGYGYVEFAGAVLMCAALVVDQGFGPYGAREIAQAPERTSALTREIVLVRFVLAAVAYLGVVGLALWLAPSPAMTQLLLLYGLSLLATPLLLQWVFQGHDRMGTAAAIQAIRQVVYAVAVFVLVRADGPVWPVAVAEILGVSAAGVYGVWMYRRLAVTPARGWFTLSPRLLREGVPIGLSQMFWTVRMFGATLILGLIAAPADVGFFASAQRLLIALHAFVWLYYFNLLPSFARAWRHDPAHFGALVARSLHTAAWLGALVALGWVTLAPLVVTTVYGAAFAPAAAALQALAGVFLVAALSGPYRYGLIAAGQQTAEMLCSAVGAVAALAFIPLGYRQAGPAGAAWGLLAAEVVVWGAAWAWARHALALHGHVRRVAPPLLALTLALALGWPWTNPALRLGAALAVFAAAAWLLDPEMRAYLRGTVGIATGLAQPRPRPVKETPH